MKYDKKLAERLCKLIETGKHTIDSCCDAVGIAKQTFYDWRHKKVDFSDMVELALDKRGEAIKERALTALYKRVEFHEYEEVKTEFAAPKKEGDKPKVLSQTRTKKVLAPSDALIQYALNNLESKRFKNKAHVDHTTDGQSLSFANFLMQASTVADSEN
jgi:hypothetical protein